VSIQGFQLPVTHKKSAFYRGNSFRFVVYQMRPTNEYNYKNQKGVAHKMLRFAHITVPSVPENDGKCCWKSVLRHFPIRGEQRISLQPFGIFSDGHRRAS